LIDTKNWNFLYKLDSQGRKCVSQHTYEPLLNPEENILCYNFTEHNNYCNKVLKTDTCEFFFQREIEALERFESFGWCPKLIDVEYNNRKIYIEFSNNLINHVMQKNTQSMHYYKKSAITVIKAHKQLGIYKYSLHPSSYFVVNNQLKSINYFFCYNFNEQDLELQEVFSHISDERLKKLYPLMDTLEIDPYQKTSLAKIQELAFETFKSDFPSSTMDTAKKLYVSHC